MDWNLEINIVSKHLGFGLDDREKVKQLFINWIEQRTDHHFDLLQIWAYHWIRRYYYKKYISFQIYSESDAEQLIGMAFIKFHKSNGSLKPSHNIQAWVNLICKQILLDYYRSNYSKIKLLSIDKVEVEFDFLDDLIKELDHQDVIKTLFNELSKKLSDDMLKILRMKIIDQKTNREISSELGLDTISISKMLFNAYKRFRNSKIIKDLLQNRTEINMPT